MKKRKSVTNLREKDTKSGVNKYVLTHQEVDSDGDFATKLVKGDIVPTAGGGTAVVFNDVEVVKQKSPGDRLVTMNIKLLRNAVCVSFVICNQFDMTLSSVYRKRKSYEHLRPEDFDGEWTDTEDRCRIAVEGHGHMKRVKTSAV